MKKRKREASETKAALARAEKEVETDDGCAMSAHAPRERKWGDSEGQDPRGTQPLGLYLATEAPKRSSRIGGCR